MKYKKFIEDNFLIDDAKTGKLVPFVFNKAQKKYYRQLIDDYDIEKKGINVPVREMIVKARKQGFSSFILALFAADDILQDNPTTTQVISYKDDGTKVFRKRYRNYIKSFFAKQQGCKILEIKDKDIFDTDSDGRLTLKHNGALFLCETASAKTASRGSTVHKLLLTESAFFPDTDKVKAKEMVEGSTAQMSPTAGWVFNESTANGTGNYHHKSYRKAQSGQSRFKARFYSWKVTYSEEEYELITSQMTDEDMIKQEFPEFVEDAFLTTGLKFCKISDLEKLQQIENPLKELIAWENLKGINYIEQCEIIHNFLRTLEEKFKENNLYVGIDVAKSEDQTVVTVLKDNEAGRGEVKCISIDSTGAGDFMPDWFDKNTRYKINRVKFSRTTKDIMYKNLQVVIAEQLTKIPAVIGTELVLDEQEKGFLDEMLALNKEIKGGLIVVSHPKGGHDDYSDSWALAEHSYVLENGVVESKTHYKENIIQKELLKVKYNKNYDKFRKRGI